MILLHHFCKNNFWPKLSLTGVLHPGDEWLIKYYYNATFIQNFYYSTRTLFTIAESYSVPRRTHLKGNWGTCLEETLGQGLFC